jgi:hypothetical protein
MKKALGIYTACDNQGRDAWSEVELGSCNIIRTPQRCFCAESDPLNCGHQKMIMAILALRERETIAGQKPSSAPAARRVVRPQSEPDANARLKDATAVHPAVIGIAMVAAFWLAFAAWVGFAGDKEAAVVIAVVIFITAMFLGLLAGGGWCSRNMTAERRSTRSFRDFLNGVVEIETGKIPGRQALFQIAGGPVLLAIGGTLMCAAWAGVGG